MPQLHKSQGGQWPAVVVALVRGHQVMLTRNLLYTAVTRAAHGVFVGDPAALAAALRCATAAVATRGWRSSSRGGVGRAGGVAAGRAVVQRAAHRFPTAPCSATLWRCGATAAGSWPARSSCWRS